MHLRHRLHAPQLLVLVIIAVADPEIEHGGEREEEADVVAPAPAFLPAGAEARCVREIRGRTQ